MPLSKSDLTELFSSENSFFNALVWGIKYAKYLKQVRTKHLRANFANEKKLMNRLLDIYRDIRQDTRLGMNMYEIHTKYDQVVLDAMNSGVFQSVTSGTAYTGDVLEVFVEYGKEHVDRAKALVRKYWEDWWIVIDELWSYHRDTGKVILHEEDEYEEIPIRDLENPQKLDFRTRTKLVATSAAWDGFNEGVIISTMLIPETEHSVMFLARVEDIPNPPCDFCMSHHGEVWPADSPKVHPPGDCHPRCRCILVPVRSEK